MDVAMPGYRILLIHGTRSTLFLDRFFAINIGDTIAVNVLG